MLHSSHSCDTPKVSVIVPCYNEPEDVFRRSLESVIHQTLNEIEIIIVLDNPENKDLERIVLEYAMKYDNILICNPGKNLGRGEARNFGISGARGEYIAIHDADDVDVPERLEEQFGYMEEYPNIGVCFSNTLRINASGEIISKPGSNPNPSSGSPFYRRLNHQTMFIRKEIFQDSLGYPNLNEGEDADLWMQLFIKGVEMGKCDSVHCYYLDPNESTHSVYHDKIKKWRLSSLKFYVKYFKHIYKDPVFYKLFLLTVSDLLFLNLGKGIYSYYEKKIGPIKRKLLKQ